MPFGYTAFKSFFSFTVQKENKETFRKWTYLLQVNYKI